MSEKLRVGDAVVATRSHFGWTMNWLTEGEVYFVTHVGSYNEPGNEHYPVTSSNGTTYGDTFFRKATIEELTAKLAAVYSRLESFAESHSKEARDIWFGGAM